VFWLNIQPAFSGLKVETVCSSKTLLSVGPNGVVTQKININIREVVSVLHLHTCIFFFNEDCSSWR
jgi:hypothetical protein